MRILVTGADGFIGRNLAVRLRELSQHEVVPVARATRPIPVADIDWVFHLAGVNRPQSDQEFVAGNVGFTESLCAALAATKGRIPVVFASSTHATLDTPYGRSKLAAEDLLKRHGVETGSPVHILRLTNVFGKWARPHYNSVVATFCHQIGRGLPVTVNDPGARLRLLYIDDLVETFVRMLGAPEVPGGYCDAGPVHETTVGELERLLREFAASRATLLVPRVGTGLTRALYATYVSHLPPEAFAYDVPRHADRRGEFVEMLKTQDSGQFSYFTAGEGVTRGEHYHHTKTEKFLVIRGTARFRFRNLVSGEIHELTTTGGEPRIVESIPGWAHDVTNAGRGELVVMLWANEIFDRARPDTHAAKVTA